MTLEQFETAVIEHRPYLVRFAARQLGDLDTADDMVQQTFMELYEAHERFDVHGLASVKTWFLNRLKSRCVDEQRGRARHSGEPPQLLREEEDQGREYDYEDERHTEPRFMIQESVREVLRMLPEEFRNVAIACLIEGQSQEEAGVSLRLSRDQVVRKLVRAKARLAKELGDFRPTNHPITDRQSLKICSASRTKSAAQTGNVLETDTQTDINSGSLPLTSLASSPPLCPDSLYRNLLHSSNRTIYLP